MKNVFDMTKRLKKDAKATQNGTTAPVIDMVEAREEILSQERRKVKRTILSEFIGAVALVPGKGLMKVILYDISENGLAFDIEGDIGHFTMAEEVAMRVYLNHQTYFGFVVKVANLRMLPDENVYRHGVNFVKGTINDEALHHFVKFIETVSASLHSDGGDIMVSGLTR